MALQLAGLRWPPVRSRCLHPGQQHGRGWRLSSSSTVLEIRGSRVAFILASSIQKMSSLRAKGVMSLRAWSAGPFTVSAGRRSAGSACTTHLTMPGNGRGMRANSITRTSTREALPCQNGHYEGGPESTSEAREDAKTAGPMGNDLAPAGRRRSYQGRESRWLRADDDPKPGGRARSVTYVALPLCARQGRHSR